jgi:hypothetical protein
MIYMAPKSAARLHEILVTSTLRAPMSFFESVDSSVLLNRFSEDMSVVDLALPVAAFVLFLSIRAHVHVY